MQSIITKYLPATNMRGARIKAQASGWGDKALSLNRSYDYALSAEDNHLEAAHALAIKLKWPGNWAEGANAGGQGNVYVCTKGRSFDVPEEVRS